MVVRVGIAGWRYPGWRGDFYPVGLPQRRELEHASRRLTSIEVNGSFYSLQRPTSYAAWRAETPEDFVFSVKGPRYVTHLKRLVDVDTALANFFASGVLGLGPKLGPVLWQLPETLRFDAGVLDAFLAALPRTTGQAAALAERHDDKVKEGRSLTVTERDVPLRHALEFRSATFADEAAYEVLRRHGVACVLADTAGRWPAVEQRHRRLRLRPAARRPGALRQRLHRRGARRLGRAVPRLGRRRPRRLRLLRQRRQGPRTARRDGADRAGDCVDRLPPPRR